ncbi:hypothetical protein NC661_13510 [Aquibacillus koreensis]|uniref:Uncharacterized protein n=1 Tax=Aquibacillus koreensis TaxID=279446 RepID=A0A9X4AKH0_9BACI|nr:hypothetical protein [Aquibacillus koreensis]MCT2536260.1 hypothetical protein [Aquibacillus koreensis]MDC3421388.1 hypothetical protein [Aquibacillus koreensis]
MEFTDLVKELGYNISFEAISEPRTKSVALRLIVNRSKDASDLLIFPHPDSKVTTFQIDFPNYITYSVVYDDYTVWNDEQIFEGESFRIYKKSTYLDYVQKEFKLQDKKVEHYSLACFEHHVDIISEHEPIITEISL